MTRKQGHFRCPSTRPWLGKCGSQSDPVSGMLDQTQVMVELPKGFLLGANYVYHQAGTWTPTARINTGLRNDTILIKERDGTDRWENRSLLDLRVQWSARLGGDARLTLIADTLNVFNNDAAQRVRTTRVGSSELGGPRNIVKPRRLQLGAKIQF